MKEKLAEMEKNEQTKPSYGSHKDDKNMMGEKEKMRRENFRTVKTVETRISRKLIYKINDTSINQ